MLVLATPVISTINISDNGASGAGTSVDYSTLETIVDNFRAAGADGINEDAVFKFANADAITIDDADEVTAYVADITSGALALTNQTVTVNSGVGLSVTNAKSIANDTSGAVTATIASGTRVSDLTELRNPGGGNEENAWTITIDGADASTTSASLNTIDDATSVAVNAAAVTSLTGTAASLTTLFTSVTSGTITGIDGAETTILADSAGTSASQLHALKNRLDAAAAANSVTPSSINASSVTSFTGVTMDLLAVYSAGNSGQITGLGAEDITVTGGTGLLSVHDANLLDSYTTGVITGTIIENDASTLATLTNTSTTGVIDASKDRHAYTITVTESADAGDILTLDTVTSVSINLESLTTLTGSLAEVEGVFTLDDDSKVSLGDSPNVAVTISDASITIADANTLAAQTSGVVTATIYEGTYSDLTDETDGLTETANNYAINLSEAITVDNANTLQGKTVGVITATISNGAIADLTSLTNTSSNSNYTITITDSGTQNAADLITINSKNTSGTIAAANIATIQGSAANVISAYAAVDSGLGDENISINDGSATLAQAISLNALTSGNVTATLADTRVSDLLDSSNGLTETGGTNAYTITVGTDDASVSASDLNSLNALTTVAVNINNVTSITASDLSDLTTLNSNRTGFSNIDKISAITLTDNGGGASVVDYGTLETIVDDYQDNFNSSVVFSFQSGDTIDIDSSDELTAYLTDIGSGALALTDQAVTIDSSVSLSVSNARTIAADTTGTVTGAIDTASRVSALRLYVTLVVGMKKMHGQLLLVVMMQLFQMFLI